MTFSPISVDAFYRAAVQKDPIETARVLEELFGLDVAFEYYPESLQEKADTYVQLKELLKVYKASIHPLLSSPLHFAAATGLISRLKEIRDPALLNIADRKGMTPLHYAIAFKQKEAILYLASECDLNC